MFCRLLFFIKSCWNCFCRFYDFITRNDWIVNNVSYIFPVFATTCKKIPNTTFLYTWCSLGFSHLYQHLLLFSFWLNLHFLPSNLYSHLHDVCYVKNRWFIYKTWNMFIYIFCLFGTHTLRNTFSRVLHFLAHLPKLIAKE